MMFHAFKADSWFLVQSRSRELKNLPNYACVQFRPTGPSNKNVEAKMNQNFMNVLRTFLRLGVDQKCFYFANQYITRFFW